MNDDEIETVTVDSYTTLVDVQAQEEALEEHVDGIDDPAAVSRDWRTQYISYSVVANDIEAYRPFHELIDLGLQYALRLHGHDVSADERETIRRTVYEDRLRVFEDVPTGVRRIADAGYDVYVLSNGSPRMLDALVDAADLGDVVVDTISADEVETYKPDPTLYRHAAARTGTPIDRILHVSGGAMRDVWGASHAGMRTCWLARPETAPPREFLGADPDVEAGSFTTLADRLD